MPKGTTILFDLSKQEMLNIFDNDFSDFLELLKSLRLEVRQNDNKNITNNELQKTDILVIGNPIDDYFSNIEIRNIVNFVRSGGSLLLISEYGSDYLQKTNLNDISGVNFGIYFHKNIVKEYNSINQNCSSILSIQDFNKHKITNQLRELIIGGTCSLLLNKTTKSLIFSKASWSEIYNGSQEQWLKENEEKEQIISACIEYGQGKVVAIGDIDIFSNDRIIGLNCLDNRKFVINLISWLLEPIKKSDVMLWALNQLGALQTEVKEINKKIDNIIETMTILENRISTIEDIENEEYKKSFGKSSDEETIEKELY